MVKQRWYAGKVTHKTKSTAEDAAQYLAEKGIQYRIRKLKKGYKVDMKI